MKINPVCRIIIDILDFRMNIYTLRRQAGREEIDYLLLKSLLSDVAYPRDKITRLLQTQALIRVKKGLYVFGVESAKKPFSTELLANLIYGPSAISLHYALSFYGIIPERVYTITSITNKRNKQFSTPVGEFSYRYLSSLKYAIGIARLSIDAERHVFIATPEKALADLLLLSCPKKSIKNIQELKHYLLNDQRMEEKQLKSLNIPLLRAIADVYQSLGVNLLVEYVTE